MTNKEIIENKINEENREYGDNKKIAIYHEILERINKKNLEEILGGIDYGDSTDVDLRIGRTDYVVEIAYSGDEIDFMAMTKKEYIERYGDERYFK